MLVFNVVTILELRIPLLLPVVNLTRSIVFTTLLINEILHSLYMDVIGYL